MRRDSLCDVHLNVCVTVFCVVFILESVWWSDVDTISLRDFVCLFVSARSSGVSLRLLERQQSDLLQRIMGRHCGELMLSAKTNSSVSRELQPIKQPTNVFLLSCYTIKMVHPTWDITNSSLKATWTEYLSEWAVNVQILRESYDTADLLTHRAHPVFQHQHKVELCLKTS